jgi:hypothetical protein
MPKSRVRVRREQRSLALLASAAFHIAILIGLAVELDKPIPEVESPAIQVTLAPPMIEPPPIPIPIPKPKPLPAPVKPVPAPVPTPATAPAPQKAPVKPVAAPTPTPLTAPTQRQAPVEQVKAPTPITHTAPRSLPTPIAHTAPMLVPSPSAPVLLPPAPQVAAGAPAAPSAAAAAAAAAPGAAAGPSGLGNALRLGFGCLHPDAVNLTPAERETCRRMAAGRGGPAFNIHPPAYIEHEGEVNEAWRNYQTSNSSHDYPGLHCAAGRDCEPDKPTPPPDPINDTCPYLRCNMGSVR